ncbi:helix-turn-helix domain-containing protein [Streptomyces sp. cg28]|uniref:helix-turn-helix domain-containing protein n=1 Tax=Streptomyces sp. cg28 TaxID=3403457 RepID=UPI003B2236B5
MNERTSGAAALKRLRERRCLSLSKLARALLASASTLHLSHMPTTASVQRSVSRWEAGSSVPDLRYQLLLAHVYARTAAGQVSLGAGSDFATLLDALALLGESERRIADVRTDIIRAVTDQGGASILALLTPGAQDALATAMADPSRTDEVACAALASTVANVNAEVGSLPFVRLQLLLSPAVEACRRLLAGPVPAELLPQLRSTAVAASTLAGRLAFETRDDAASRALYAEATAQAGQLAEPWRQAGVHMSHALVTLYSQDGLEQPRTLVDAAVRAARSGDSVLVRARAHALQAEIAARAGLERQTDAALSLSWYDMESDHAGDPSPSSFTAGHLRGFEGVCQLWVGDPERAHDQFSRSAEALSGRREQVQRAIVTTDQALARIRMGEPRDAAGLLHECVTAASTTGGRVPAIRLRRARQELRPWRREDWVQDLDDHLMDVLGA